jgi:hypothetical protein
MDSLKRCVGKTLVFKLKEYVHNEELIIPAQEIEVKILSLTTSGEIQKVGVHSVRAFGEDVASEINEVMMNKDVMFVRFEVFKKGGGVKRITLEGDVVEVY